MVSINIILITYPTEYYKNTIIIIIYGIEFCLPSQNSSHEP